MLFLITGPLWIMQRIIIRIRIMLNIAYHREIKREEVYRKLKIETRRFELHEITPLSLIKLPFLALAFILRMVYMSILSLFLSDEQVSCGSILIV